jgi:hypothetical protein
MVRNQVRELHQFPDVLRLHQGFRLRSQNLYHILSLFLMTLNRFYLNQMMPVYSRNLNLQVQVKDLENMFRFLWFRLYLKNLNR